MAYYLAKSAGYIDFGVLQWGPTFSGATAVSIFAWVRAIAPTTGTSDNVVCIARMSANAGAQMSINAAVSGQNKVRILGRSLSADSAQSFVGTTATANNVWFAAGGVLDYTNKTITTYVNGVLDAQATGISFGSNTWVMGTGGNSDYLSFNSPTSSQTGCELAQVAFWKGDIGANGFKALAKGISPRRIRRDLLTIYLPLMGSQLINQVNRSNVGSFGGTPNPAKVKHPPVRFH